MTDDQSVWSKPEYAAADAARTAWLQQDPNDHMGALAAAVDAALRQSEEPSEAVLAERERCAKVAENITYRDPDRRDDGSLAFGFGFDVASERIAAAIRQGDA